MRPANNWAAPRWMRAYALSATRVGDGWLWYAMGLAILLFGGDSRFAALGAAGTAAVLSILLFIVLKRFTGRRRPCQIEPHCWATLLPPDQFSFPSGHTMTAFAVAIALSLFYPKLGDRPAVLRAQHCAIAHSAGYALLERCGCGRADRHRPRLSGLLRVLIPTTVARRGDASAYRRSRESSPLCGSATSRYCRYR